MKDIKEYINEWAVSKENYRVCFICKDKLINATILIDKTDTDEFEKFLTDEQDNIFAHAEGGKLEY